jgi:N-acyl-L-homoserine lactone synthetase
MKKSEACERRESANQDVVASIVTVTDTRMERVLRRAGWPLERLAPPQRVGKTMALAGFLHGSRETLAAMYRQAGVEGPVLLEPGSVSTAA